MVNKIYVNQEDDEEDGELVPQLVVEDLQDLSENKDTPLRKVAEKFQFPLKDEDFKDLAKLGLRFDGTEDAVGLSLPQLGIHKRAFIFEVRKPPPAEEGKSGGEKKVEPPPKKTRDELLADDLDPMAEPDLQKLQGKYKEPDVIWPKSLWINPTYTIPRDAVLDEDYEICYSLKCQNNLVVGPVFRLNRINYRAYDSQGKIYEGTAEGMAARVIQHEIDHLDGKLYIDYVQPERVMPLPDYLKQMENGEALTLEKGVVPEFAS